MYQYLNQKIDSLEQYFWCNLEWYLDGDLVRKLDSNLGLDLERNLDSGMD